MQSAILTRQNQNKDRGTMRNRHKESNDHDRYDLRFRSIVQASIDAVITADDQGRILSWNKGAETIFGYKEQEVLGEPITLIIPERFQLAHDQGIDRVKRGGPKKAIGRTLELYGQKKDKKEIPIELSLSAWMCDGRQYFGGIIRDITQRKKLEENLKAKKQQLHRLNQQLEERVVEEVNKRQDQEQLLIQHTKMAEMGEMLGMIAHQWKQPLSLIGVIINEMKLGAELGNRDAGHEAENHNEILKQIQYLAQSITDFSTFLRPDNTKKLVNLNEVIDNSLKIIGKSLKYHNIKLELDYNFTQNTKTFPNELIQVLINIMKNAQDELALKKIESPKISIKGIQEEHAQIIEIADNAGGIPEELLPKIFDSYFTTKGKSKGTGIGLYMSKIIVEKHCEGTLKAVNQEEGACFRIRLPNQ